ncbi:MAG: hypothetical protein AB1589_27435 [Cyanobacteriota bacterium]
MLKQHTDIDAQIIELKRKYNTIIQLLQEFQEQLDAVEAEVRIVTTSQADRIAELECLSNPYSQEGTPICNLP